MTPLDVLVVAGNGQRAHTKPERDFLIGLKRVLSPEQVASLRIRPATHHELFDEARRTQQWPTAGDVSIQSGEDFKRCACCPNGDGYELFVKLNKLLGYRDWAWTWGSVDLWELKDVRAYLTAPSVRETVIDEVAQSIQKLRPTVVIGHSLGSIVTVEAIAKSGPKRAPKLVITAGAPFAWPRFAAQWSAPARAWMSNPGVAWLNVVDLSDPVTASVVPATDMYAGATHVVVDNDHLVNRKSVWRAVVDGDAPLGGASTHMVRHYLSHPPVAEAFAEVFPHVG